MKRVVSIFAALLLVAVLSPLDSASAETLKDPQIIYEKLEFRAKGTVHDLVDMSYSGLLKSYKEARIAASNAIRNGATLILHQNYDVFHAGFNAPIRVKREVILAKSSSFGKPEDERCIARVYQEGSFATNREASSLSHTNRDPGCRPGRPVQSVSQSR
jgi:hypothetical protein